MDNSLLSLLIWLPIFAGVLVILIGNERANTARWISVAVSILVFIISLSLYTEFDSNTHLMQFEEKASWISQFNIYYHLGVDGISMPLIILTTFSTILVLIAGWEVIKTRPAHYMAAFLMMEGLIIGVFSSLDAILFYAFWEASLIPMLLIIGVWGGNNRVYAAIKFFLYTFLGSVFMLVSLIYMYNKGGSFSILDMHNLSLTAAEQAWIFWAFFMAFAVKVPMFPVHTWLPDAHVQAPTGGSVILAAIMLKMGGYGFFRFSLPITPDASYQFSEVVIILSLIAIVYIGFVALVQRDMKKLIAYSSISHMGFVTLGVFALFLAYKPGAAEAALLGLEGAMVQMISHGFISAAMFLVVGVLYDRLHSREISTYGGVINSMPKFTGFAVLFAMANAGLPGTSGFVGEFMVILGAVQANIWYGVLAGSTLIVGAAYTLWMVKRVFWGAITNPAVETLSDINAREFGILAVLAIAVIAMGLYPQPVIEVIHVTIEHLLNQALTSKL
ncbi:NADH-ubiquinone oxidoreductase chain M (EC 1.6.5.3) [uncultured Gammaproteobacteria bacterium]|uniref:NADH-quinone oxidoreductase subunit M n=1 Tax=Bathymodiolus heckerae thiotrophic gill symbiont TaxID=1052212 RepID=UPI0010BA44F8|nr:NADH-quinone oxidoreductase subunit M [Bathymodiolus heckerae thiotrophic gill symbiont]CAC9543467.1 NADH-ubiquinone oxidoreductase chain M (EC 1.6.5.3) [uncultured Gammaproteobacteria bacterium]CAC9594478.1 NADH-ubiquinone oxidoreductase chain M (EC 1.6.5.3) [uncultured Gammaproteobacteria bacterium]CAC9957012.1 NADH-ubiquinone oxidoreductase chain M (EC 1.6.5.3) [uncultured Gammaproteobacteria bacterium]SHN90296.1 NADH-ubiquinone oxidoreductase chain M [Bathymodiolus heckerae thiotrophic g